LGSDVRYPKEGLFEVLAIDTLVFLKRGIIFVHIPGGRLGSRFPIWKSIKIDVSILDTTDMDSNPGKDSMAPVSTSIMPKKILFSDNFNR
jgi:hypothetical protein